MNQYQSHATIRTSKTSEEIRRDLEILIDRSLVHVFRFDINEYRKFTVDEDRSFERYSIFSHKIDWEMMSVEERDYYIFNKMYKKSLEGEYEVIRYLTKVYNNLWALIPAIDSIVEGFDKERYKDILDLGGLATSDENVRLKNTLKTLFLLVAKRVNVKDKLLETIFNNISSRVPLPESLIGPKPEDDIKNLEGKIVISWFEVNGSGSIIMKYLSTIKST